MGKENKNVKVSVIIPVYNTETYVEQCLESVTGQTLKEIEIICVDDGSTDHSLEKVMAAAEKDSRIIVLTQENAGGGAARNKGMEAARGEYLAFLDSDDYLDETMLEKMVGKARENRADITICKARRYHDNLEIYTALPGAMRDELLPDTPVFSWEDMPDAIFNAFHNWPWNKLFLRKFIQSAGITFQELHRTNDLYFTCRALMTAKRIALVKEELVTYRVGIRESCQATNREYPLDFYEAFLKLKGFLKEEGTYEQVERSYINHALDGCIANLNSQEGSPDQEMLYRQLKGCLFDNLGIRGKEQAYYFDFNREAWEAYQVIGEQDYKGYLRWRIGCLKEERDRIIRQDVRTIQDMRIANERSETKIREIYDSFTWKIGKKVSAPVRFCGRVLKRD